jgi:hypothetical protein
MLGHRVGRAADLREQAGGRRSRDGVAGTAGQPAGHEQAGGAHVCEDVDVDRMLPALVAVADSGLADHSGVGEEQINRAKPALGHRENVAEDVGARDVPVRGGAAGALSDRGCARGVTVGDDDALRRR